MDNEGTIPIVQLVLCLSEKAMTEMIALIDRIYIPDMSRQRGEEEMMKRSSRTSSKMGK